MPTRLFFLFLLIFALVRHSAAQQKSVDSLRVLLSQQKPDTSKVKLLMTLVGYYRVSNKDSALKYAQQARLLAKKIKFQSGETDALVVMTHLTRLMGNYPKALQSAHESLKLAEKADDTLQIFLSTRVAAMIYNESKNYVTGLAYARKIKSLVHSGFFKQEEEIIYYSLIGYVNMMANSFEGLNQIDSTLYYKNLSYKIAFSHKKSTDEFYLKYTNPEFKALATINLASIYAKIGHDNKAFNYFRLTVPNAIKADRFDLWANSHLGMARIFANKKDSDSAIFYGQTALKRFQHYKFPMYEQEAAAFLHTQFDKTNNIDSAYKYLTLSVVLKDSLFGQEKVRAVENLKTDELLRQQQLQQARQEVEQQYETKVRVYGLLAGLLIISIIAGTLYRTNRQKQKTNLLLSQKNDEIQHTLTELKNTQTQLIQREKMASLGELTAGIAHEIQNPLNFVNNFSEVNTELISEIEREIKEGNIEEVKSLIYNIKENEQKIKHHGQRADAIVKGMLQHSRTSSGQKQLTDINAVADEYLRLSYHGLREKEKDFNPSIVTDFDSSINQVAVVPQELGRVLLNLYNNAFYAVHQKQLLVPAGADEKEMTYQPTVKVTTSTAGNQVELRIWDNGVGIPESVKDKIFQPFFTTKPTGKGTGLGLSLSYDIITKGHGGELKMETKEGEYTEMIVHLPLHS